MTTQPQTGYAPVNGLELYYEIHGKRALGGEPILVLHGAYMSTSMMGALVAEFAKTRQVIVLDFQGHGRTADIGRPITYENLADDVAGLLGQLEVDKADVFGYSMGGGAALQLAIRHPERVDKLIVASATYKTEGTYPEVLVGIETMTPEVFAGSPGEALYQKIAPNPEAFPELVRKLIELDTTPQDWPAEDIRAIKAPTLLVIGDSDTVRPEHALELFRLLGGGVPADLTGLPNARLAVLPGTTHITVMERTSWLVPMIGEFLEAPRAKAE